jgi:hypothetical protein
MEPFEYNVSLRLKHPEIEPDDISRVLGLVPRSSGAEGEAGEAALRSEHYWVYWFEQPDGVGLRDYLKILMGKLAEHRSVFDKVTSTQGRVQLFITLPAGKSAGEVLDWQVLQKLAEMRIDLAFEIYHQG